MPSSGVSGSPIKIGAYGAGALPVLNGSVVVTGWTVDAGSRYYSTWSFPSNAVFQNDTPLIRADSAVGMTNGTFFYDPGASRLYVQTTTGTSPTEFRIEATRYGSAWQGVVNAQNKKYLIIENLKIIKGNMYGVYLAEGGHHVVRWNILEWNVTNAISAVGWIHEGDTTDIQIINNTLANNGLTRHGPVDTLDNCSSTSCDENVGIDCKGCIGTGVSGTGAVISGNTITNQGGEGIQVGAGSTDVIIENNRVVNATDIGIYLYSGFSNSYRNGGTVKDHVIRYNYVEHGTDSVGPGYAIAAEYMPIWISSINTTTDIISTGFAHKQTNGTLVFVYNYSGSLPTPLVNGTAYYMCSVTTATTKLATRSDCSVSSVVDLTSTGTGTTNLSLAYPVENTAFYRNIFKGKGTYTAGLLFGGGGQVF
jgi:parallel beta-helix repeat protein